MVEFLWGIPNENIYLIYVSFSVYFFSDRTLWMYLHLIPLAVLCDKTRPMNRCLSRIPTLQGALTPAYECPSIVNNILKCIWSCLLITTLRTRNPNIHWIGLPYKDQPSHSCSTYWVLPATVVFSLENQANTLIDRDTMERKWLPVRNHELLRSELSSDLWRSSRIT